MKAYEAYVMARFIGKARKNAISFDEVVKAMSETGNSLPIEYKETSLGGLAKVHKFQLPALSYLFNPLFHKIIDSENKITKKPIKTKLTCQIFIGILNM